MALQDEITKAIGAHGMWKTRLRMAVESGKVDYNIAEVQRDNCCEFGRWLHHANRPVAMTRGGALHEGAGFACFVPSDGGTGLELRAVRPANGRQCRVGGRIRRSLGKADAPDDGLEGGGLTHAT